MINRISIILICLILCSISCSSSNDSDTLESNAPEWFLNPPIEPGKFFYIKGVELIENRNVLHLAKITLAQKSQGVLAALLSMKLKLFLKNYAKETKSDPEILNTLIRDCFTSAEIADGARTVKSEIIEYGSKLLYFFLVAVHFDYLNKNLEEIRKRLDEISFDEDERKIKENLPKEICNVFFEESKKVITMIAEDEIAKIIEEYRENIEDKRNEKNWNMR